METLLKEEERTAWGWQGRGKLGELLLTEVAWETPGYQLSVQKRKWWQKNKPLESACYVLDTILGSLSVLFHWILKNFYEVGTTMISWGKQIAVTSHMEGRYYK